MLPFSREVLRLKEAILLAKALIQKHKNGKRISFLGNGIRYYLSV